MTTPFTPRSHLRLPRRSLARALRLAAASAALLAIAAAVPAAVPPRGGDYIVAIVNNESVTALEVERRIARAREEAARRKQSLPPEAELRKQVLDSLIEERVVVTYARDSGVRVDDAEVDRAVTSVASQNQLTIDQLREHLKTEGTDFTRFRNDLRDQLLASRVREREVTKSIVISDADVDKLLAQQNAAVASTAQLDIAQILVSVPEGADAEVVAERRERALQAVRRIKDGEAFERVATELSDDPTTREKGGDFGLRAADRLPTLFVDAVKPLSPGGFTPVPVRSAAGFHVLKLVSRQQTSAYNVTQTHARHILLRTSPEVSVDTARQRLQEVKRQIENGTRAFETAAREISEDGSAQQGGDLGWLSPGSLVPEFEEAMNRLKPGSVSDPVTSRFGVHLIQVVERRTQQIEPAQLREQAKNVLREQKFDAAYTDWVRDLRARAYVEMREPPQ